MSFYTSDLFKLKITLLTLFILGVSALSIAAPIAEYRMDSCSWSGASGEIIDSAGGDNNGTITGSGIRNQISSKICSSGSFSGGAIDINGLGVDTADGAKTTVTFWMYWDGSNSVMPFGWRTYDLWFIDGSFGFNTGNSDVYGISSDGLENGWHHVAAVFTNKETTENTLYIDSVKQELSQQRSNSPNNNSAIVQSSARIGGWHASVGYRFGGQIDELKIYLGDIGPDEIETIYSYENVGLSSDGSPRTCICLPVPDPIANYRMDECSWSGTSDEVQDSSGNNLNGTVLGDASTELSVLSGGGICQTGSFTNEQFIEVSANPLLQVNDSFSFSAWIQTTKATGTILSKTDSSSPLNGYVFSLGPNSGGKLALWFGNGWQTSTGQAINDGFWHHVAVTVDGGTLRFYVDGSLDDTQDFNGIENTTTALLQIGLEQNSSAAVRHFDGSLDEVKIWDVGLVDNQIKQIYDHEISGQDYDGSNRSCPCAPPLVNLRMDECVLVGTSGEIVDTEGGNSNGTRTGENVSSVLLGQLCRASGFSGDAIDLSGIEVQTAIGSKTSVAFWMYWDGTNSVMPFGWNVYDLWFIEGSFGFNTGNGDVYGISSAGLANGWHHVVAVFTNGRVIENSLYIDGAHQFLSQLRKTPNDRRAYVQSDARIGGWLANTGYRFSGQIDEFKIYQGDVGLSKVQTIYNNELNGLNYTGESRVCPCIAAEYRFDLCSETDTIIDDSGNGFNGDVRNGPLAIDSGKLCNGAVFDGVDDYIEIDDSDQFDNTSALTISGWIKPEDIKINPAHGNARGIVSKRRDYSSSGNIAYGIFFYSARGDGKIYVDLDKQDNRFSSNAVITEGIWTHFAVVFDGTLPVSERAKIYINGALDKVSSESSTTIPDYSSNLYVGNLYTGPTELKVYKGMIDELRISPVAFTAADIAGLYATTRSSCQVCGTVDHIRIEHSGSGLTCQSSEIYLRACADDTCSIESGDPIDVTMSPSSVDPLTWIRGDSYTFTGHQTVSLRQTVAGEITLGVTATNTVLSNVYRCYEDGVEEDCTIAFYDAGIFIDGDSDAGTRDSDIETQIAGKPSNVAPNAQIFQVRVLRTDNNSGACIASLVDNSNALFSYLVPEVANGLTDNTMTLTSTVESETLQSVGSTKELELDFNGDGAAAFWLTSVDAGKYQLRVEMDILVTDSDGNPLTDAEGNPTGETFSVSDTSNAYVVRPFAVFVDGAGNPKASDGSGAAYKKTGEDFTLNFKSLSWTASRDGNNDGQWDSCGSSSLVDPGSGYVRVPQWGIGQPAASLVKPTGGVSGTLNYDDGDVTMSAKDTNVTASNITYDQVGIVQLAQDGINDFLGQSVALCSPYIGRFYPDRFQLAQGALTNRVDNSCSTASGFTYLGEDLLFNYSLTAQNSSGETATNYAGSFSRFAGTGAVPFGSSGTYTVVAVDDPAGTAMDLSSRLDIVNSSKVSGWSAGVASFNIKLNVERDATADGPFADTRFGVFVQDSDGVEITNQDLDVNTDNVMDYTQATDSAVLRYGRIRLDNAHGSEMLALPMLMRAEYWMSSVFSWNTLDSCSSFDESILTLKSEVESAGSGDSSIRVKGGFTTTAAINNDPLSNGDGDLTFSAPGLGGDGWVDVVLTVPEFLQFDWHGAGNENPTSRATFGIYQGNEHIIYIRETTWR